MSPLLAPALIAVALCCGGCAGLVQNQAGYVLEKGADGTCLIKVLSERAPTDIGAEIDGETCSVSVTTSLATQRQDEAYAAIQQAILEALLARTR